MNDERDFERATTDWLEAGTDVTPPHVIDAVLLAVRTTPQERDLRVPWRTPIMNKLVIGLGAAAVVVIGLFLGSQLLGSPTNVGGPGVEATPTAEASVAQPTPEPSGAEPSPTAAAPLTETFTSRRHGISLSYPGEWTVEPATERWTGAEPPIWSEPAADFLYDPVLRDHLFLSIASQPIGDSSPDEWLAEHLSGGECSDTEQTTVDGATGLIGAAGCNVAAVTTDGRGYIIALYTSGDEAWIRPTYDRAWFEEVLATVQLHPEDAGR